ncbi:MAG: glycerol-3-phosphate acyltransferase [Ignavibacteriales bacterium]|nr:glycerol-3-phosphate acyltransferase [Ignavibacteriales bacterium]
MNYILSFLIGYIIGSLPTAYLIMKRFLNIDIRTTGSGNVGALNSFEVSKSKMIGLTVFIIDLLKGLTAVLLTKLLIGDEFIFVMISLNAAVLAHCFSPWINFKGGRGIATAGGGALFISIPMLLLWALIWLISFGYPRNIHIANVIASILTALISFTSAFLLNQFSFPHAVNNLQFSIYVSLLMLIILTKYYVPMKELILKVNNKN